MALGFVTRCCFGSVVSPHATYPSRTQPQLMSCHSSFLSRHGYLKHSNRGSGRRSASAISQGGVESGGLTFPIYHHHLRQVPRMQTVNLKTGAARQVIAIAYRDASAHCHKLSVAGRRSDTRRRKTRNRAQGRNNSRRRAWSDERGQDDTVDRDLTCTSRESKPKPGTRNHSIHLINSDRILTK